MQVVDFPLVPVIEIIKASLFNSKNKSKSVIIFFIFFFKYFLILHLFISIPGLMTILSIRSLLDQNLVRGIFIFFIFFLIFLLSSQQNIFAFCFLKNFAEERESIQQQLKLFKDCNSPCIVFAEVSGSIQGDPNRKLSTRPKMNLDESKDFYKKISEMGKYLQDEGMPLAYHHHMGTVIESQDDTERLLENTHDSVKLTLDTGHMLFAQGDSKKVINDFNERLIHVHCKDIRKVVLENSLKNDLSFRGAFLEGAFTVPGDGCIDYKPIFDILKEKKYSGWLVVEAEQDPAKANPFEYAKIGYNYLTETLKKSNIEIFKN